MKKIAEYSFIICWILALGYLFQQNYFDEFPKYSNARDQSNSLAISKGYILNNLDFSEPQTYVYNKETLKNESFILDKNQDQINNTRTAVHFPVHNYFPALISSTFDFDLIKTIRWYTFIFSLLGAIFLYKLIRLLTDNFFKSWLIITFAITTPVFVYYQSGFLSVIPSLSLAIIGIYMYFNYHSKNKLFFYFLAIACITLASLATYFFLSILLALMSIEIYFVVQKKKLNKFKLIVNTIAFIIIVLSAMLYFRRVSIYGSVFTDIQNMHLPKAVKGVNWNFTELLLTYFSISQLILFGILVLGFALSYFFHRKGLINLTFIKPFWQFLMFYFAGCFLFLFFLHSQFQTKDHLFLATFYLPIILLLTLFTKHLNFTNKWIRLFYTTSGLAIILIMTVSAFSIQREKRISGTWDIGTETVYNYEGSAEFLAKHGVKPSDRILVFNSTTPNIPFILMNRTGFAIEGTNKEDILKALSWRYKYIIYQNQFFIPTIYTAYPEIIQRIEIVATNGRITICKLKENPLQENTLTSFLNFDKMNSVGTYYNNFSSADIENWEIDSLYHIHWSKPSSNFMHQDSLYGLNFKTNSLKLNDASRHLMYMSGRFYQDSLANCELVAYISDGENTVYYQSYHVSDFIKKEEEWHFIELVYEFPKLNKDYYEVGFKVYNPQKARLVMDDITLKVF